MGKTTKTKKTKKTETPKGIEVKRKIKFELNQSELAEKAKEIGKLRGGLDKLVAQFCEVKRDWNERIKKITDKLVVLENQCDEVKEEREVMTTAVKDHDEQTVRYFYKGEVVETRPMTEVDRQEELTLKNAGKKRTNSKKENSIIVPPTTEEQDIADVVKAETSKRTKHSAVDGEIGNGHADSTGLYDLTGAAQ